MLYSKQKMFCTICGEQYDWTCNSSYRNTLTCCRDCHREWKWRETLSIMGKEYYLRRKIGFDFGNVIKQIGGPIMPGFLEAFKVLREKFNEEVYIISRVDDEAGSCKALNFLTENGLLNCDGGFENPHIKFCYQRHEKAYIASALGLTHFVDDRTEVLSFMKDVNAVTYRFALNPTPKQIEMFPPTGGIVAVKTWNDLLPLILATLNSKVEHRHASINGEGALHGSPIVG